MSADELRELAKTLNGIADGKPWQMRSSENVEWGLASGDADPMDVIKAGFQIRLKPWELTGTVNGHTLPAGASWHRQDFTEDMLPAPYRPLMLGEKTGTDVELYPPTHGKWIREHCPLFHFGAAGDWSFHRTTRPIPFTLTKEQIADGWVLWSGGECPVEPESRPTVMYRNGETECGVPARTWTWGRVDGEPYAIIAYRPDPYGKFRQALADGKTIQIVNSERNWVSLASPSFSDPIELYRIKQEPQWLPLDRGDIQPGSVLRKKDWPEGAWEIVLGTKTGIIWREFYEPFESIMDNALINRPRHRDADGNPTLWEECRKQAP